MIRKILYVHFSHLFGNCRPIAINDWDDMIQIKYSLADMDSKMIFIGLERLEKVYKRKAHVRVLFVYPGILQVIIGSEEAVSRTGNSDFRIEVC